MRPGLQCASDARLDPTRQVYRTKKDDLAPEGYCVRQDLRPKTTVYAGASAG